MRPQRPFGLRSRLVAALVLTSAATLAVTAVSILSPLEHRLRRNTGTTLVVAADSARSAYGELLREEGSAHDKRLLRHLNASLARRTGAGATLVSRSGVIVASDPDAAASPRDAVRAIAAHRSTRVERDNVVIIASPLRIARTRYAIVLRKHLNDVGVALHVVRRAFLTAAVAGLLVSLVLGFGLSTALLRRLGRLREAVIAARKRGPDAEFPQDTGRDEIGELARAFAEMQDDVRHQESARRSFVATASHELRTPLASLQSTLELLAEDLGDGEPDLDYARGQVIQARQQAGRLSGLATDLLDLSRLDADVALRREPVDVGELALVVAAEFGVRTAGSDNRLKVTCPTPTWAIGDPGAIARILRILIENALRFSPPSQPVEILVAADESTGMAKATVSDRGPGVPAEERELIFERFRRGTLTGGAGGFGLGLAIGRELADRMGGSLTIDQPCGPGASFALRVPGAS